MEFYVGPVEKIVLGMVVYVCACCSLSVQHCRCEHDPQYDHLQCPNRDKRPRV